MIDLSSLSQDPNQNPYQNMSGWQKALAGVGAMRSMETSPTGLMTPSAAANNVQAPSIGGQPYGKGFQMLMQPGILKLLSSLKPGAAPAGAGIVGMGGAGAGAAGAAGGTAAGGMSGAASLAALA